jgi:hypothetical protein
MPHGKLKLREASFFHQTVSDAPPARAAGLAFSVPFAFLCIGAGD